MLSVLAYIKCKECSLAKEALEVQVNSYSHMVYVASEELPKGTVLTEDKVYREIRYCDLEGINYITEEDFGKTVIFDIKAGACITAEMLYEESKKGKEVFLTEIAFPDYIQAGDRVDIRIRYENAEDYTVVTDKNIVVCDSGNGIVLELTEEEILFISSAYSDIKKYEGTRMYCVKYPEYSSIKENSSVTYIPNREIVVLTGKEKTEGESREALEARLLQEQ